MKTNAQTKASTQMFIPMLAPRTTLCDFMDSRQSGSSVHGILQAGIQEWAAMPLKKTVNLDGTVCWGRILTGSLQGTINSGYSFGGQVGTGWMGVRGGRKNCTDYHFILSDLGTHMNMVYNSVREFLSAL